MTTVPEGFPTPEETAAAGRWLITTQQPDGALPWEPGRHTDPWDHVEAAMGLDVAGHHAEAAAAYEWLVNSQNPDGGWFSSYDPQGEVLDHGAQSGYNGYIAVGVWHHLLATGDEKWARRLWPTVARALDWVVDLQLPDGRIAWARNKHGAADPRSLVTGSASLVQSLRTGALLGERFGDSRPEWELVADRLGHTLTAHPGAYWDRSQWAMDWYYPVLCGVLRGPAAARRLEERWERFVRPERGTRCVWHEPWFTVAETCELALALDIVGRGDDAMTMVAAGNRLRRPDGSWWTGWVDDGSADGALWPDEQTTWTAGALLLAVDALIGDGPTSGLFRDVPATPVIACDEHCPLDAGTDPYEATEAADVGDLGEGA